tara:strand:+ start:360 stop:533 length:174 start_codon:yes stop_codon:yes gene_type:complete
MELSYTDRIVISAALSSKADFIKEQLEKNPSDEYWIRKLEGVKTAYKNFNDRELWDD